MKRIWIVGVAAFAIAIVIAVTVQEPTDAVADPVEQQAEPVAPDIEDVLPADHAVMEAAAQLTTEQLYEDLAVTPEEFAAQVGALSVAMAATAEANAQKVYPDEDTALPAWAAEPNQ